MRSRPSSIIKLGGSLFGLPQLPARLSNYLRDFGRPRPILLCGGGAVVDHLRRWERIYGIGEEACHWIALRLLSTNSRFAERLLPELTLVDTLEDCATTWRREQVPIFDPYHFIADIDEESLDPLPRRWRVTSDSIAARMAITFGAEEVVLLKSVTVPERLSFAEAARLGIVDPHFPVAASQVPRVAAVNLRLDDPNESILFDAP